MTTLPTDGERIVTCRRLLALAEYENSEEREILVDAVRVVLDSRHRIRSIESSEELHEAFESIMDDVDEATEDSDEPDEPDEPDNDVEDVLRGEAAELVVGMAQPEVSEEDGDDDESDDDEPVVEDDDGVVLGPSIRAGYERSSPPKVTHENAAPPGERAEQVLRVIKEEVGRGNWFTSMDLADDHSPEHGPGNWCRETVGPAVWKLAFRHDVLEAKRDPDFGRQYLYRIPDEVDDVEIDGESLGTLLERIRHDPDDEAVDDDDDEERDVVAYMNDLFGDDDDDEEQDEPTGLDALFGDEEDDVGDVDGVPRNGNMHRVLSAASQYVDREEGARFHSTDVSDTLPFETARVSAVLCKLRDHGYVDSERDGRINAWWLTESGVDAMDDLGPYQIN